jgi:RHS repeat-associated protein
MNNRTSLGDLSYTWDANKNKTSETITGVMSGYGFTSGGTTYDFEDRLTGYARASGTFNQSWNLTSVGDWTSVTTNGIAQNRTHGPTHELLTAGGSSVVTDVKGNMTSIPATLRPAGATTALLLSWDFDNKLASADIDANGTADVNFQYDALGRRVARSGTGGSVVYVQMDQQTIADYPVGGAATTPTFRYVFASYIDEPVVRKTAGTGGTLVYFHRNHQYSITAVTTSTGSIAERYAYSAYGQPTILDASASVLSSSAINNRYTYTGREWDATLGLHHFRARWMSPSAGRFLGRDPIGYWDALSLSEIFRSNPFVFLDPSGFCSIEANCTLSEAKVRTITETVNNTRITVKRLECHFDCYYHNKPDKIKAPVIEVEYTGGDRFTLCRAYRERAEDSIDCRDRPLPDPNPEPVPVPVPVPLPSPVIPTVPLPPPVTPRPWWPAWPRIPLPPMPILPLWFHIPDDRNGIA